MKTERTVILAIDFDGTLVEAAWPEIGRNLGALFWLSQLKRMGCEMVLWTCRSGDALENAKAWLTENGFDDIITRVNTGAESNPFPDDGRKVYANFYVGDKAFGAPVFKHSDKAPHYDWERAGPMLIREVLLLHQRWIKHGRKSSEGAK